MDQRQLRTFITVFEERSITAASRRLCISQPAVSAIIKQMEENLNVQLFERQARGVKVTEYARMLYPSVQKLLADSDALYRFFQYPHQQPTLTIGIEEDISGNEVAAFIAETSRLSLLVQFNLEVGCLGDMRLATEDLRCEDELFIPLWEDVWVLTVPEDHQLACQTHISRMLIPSDQWVICPSHPAHQRLLPLYGNSTLRSAASAQTYSLAIALVAAGAGIAITPRSLAVAQTGIKILSLDDLQLNRRIGICYSIKSLENPLVDTICNHFRINRALKKI